MQLKQQSEQVNQALAARKLEIEAFNAETQRMKAMSEMQGNDDARVKAQADVTAAGIRAEADVQIANINAETEQIAALVGNEREEME